MKVLVLNSGSSSLKYQLFDMGERVPLEGGAAHRIGESGSGLRHIGHDPSGKIREDVVDLELADHAAALDVILDRLSTGRAKDGLVGIGHRVVHGGREFRAPQRIDEHVIEVVRSLSPLAPLHNPANLLGIEVAMALRPDVPHVAVFDTAFHQTIPKHAYRYAVPEPWYEVHGVRRYGFHGISYAYVSKQAARVLGRPLSELNLIVLHLGNGASVTAIAGGRSVDTSMGLTPLEGLVMGTRGGDVDPGAILHLLRHGGMTVDEIDRGLNKESGMTGLCGVADMRDALDEEAKGDSAAHLAVEVYVYRIRKYIGAYMAALGRVDAIVFTGGVGENSAEIRRRTCGGLDRLGVRLDDTENRRGSPAERPIHVEDGPVAVLVVPTNEELEIAEQTLDCVGASILAPRP